MMQCKARILCESGDYEMAEEIFKELLKRSPRDGQMISHYAKMLITLSRLEEARRVLVQWKEQDDERIVNFTDPAPSNTSTKRRWRFRLPRLRKRSLPSLDYSKTKYNNGAPVDRHRYETLCRLAMLHDYLYDNKASVAEKLLLESVDLSPRIPKAHNLRRLAMLYASQGNRKKTIEYLMKCRAWLWEKSSAPSTKAQFLTALASYRHILMQDKNMDLGWIIRQYTQATSYDDSVSAHANLALIARHHRLGDIATYHDLEAKRILPFYRPVDTRKPMYYIFSPVSVRHAPRWLAFHLEEPKCHVLPYGLIFNAEETDEPGWLKLPCGLYIPVRRGCMQLVKQLPEWTLKLERYGNEATGSPDHLAGLQEHYARILET